MKPSYYRRNFYVSRRPSFVPDLYSSKCRVKEDLFEPIKPLIVPWITVDLDLPPVYRFKKLFVRIPGIAVATEIPVAELAMLNIFYELSTIDWMLLHLGGKNSVKECNGP
uniref:Uncharacterized protein n=1 Tax=Ditylenchus dipsaci TaxID=166011 RepID=A0A915DHH5_9BILA